MPCVAHCVVDGAEQALGWAAFFRGRFYAWGVPRVRRESESGVSVFFFAARFNSLCCSLRFLFLVSKSVKSPIKCEGGGFFCRFVMRSLCVGVCVLPKTEKKRKPTAPDENRKPACLRCTSRYTLLCQWPQ